MSYKLKYNPFTGRLDWVTTPSVSGGSGTSADPYTDLNVKIIRSGFYYLIGADLESIVTGIQTIDGVLTVDGENTIL